MSNNNFSFNVTGQGVPIPGISGDQPIYITPQNAGLAAFISSIAPSQESQVADSYNMQIPYMAEPNWAMIFSSTPTFTAVGAIDLKINSKLNEICLGMLDQWNEDIKKAAAERREFQNSAAGKLKEEERLAHFLGNYISGVKTDSDAYIPLVTVGLVFAATGSGVRDSMMIDTLSTNMVGVNPTSNQVQTHLYASDMRAELGLLGAAILQGSAYFANAVGIGKVGGGQGPEELSARAFAELIVGLVSSGNLDRIATDIVIANTPEGKKIDKEYTDSLVGQLKLVLLTAALAGLYKSATGGLTSTELADLISGKMKTFGPDKDMMSNLVRYINEALKQIPEGSRVGFLATLFRFYDLNPDLKVLTNPAKIFAKLNAQITREHPQV